MYHLFSEFSLKMKDLKRQVQQLQKKEEKLQHQLTEFKIWRGNLFYYFYTLSHYMKLVVLYLM